MRPAPEESGASLGPLEPQQPGLMLKASLVMGKNTLCKSVWLNLLWQGFGGQEARAAPVYNT